MGEGRGYEYVSVCVSVCLLGGGWECECVWGGSCMFGGGGGVSE